MKLRLCLLSLLCACTAAAADVQVYPLQGGCCMQAMAVEGYILNGKAPLQQSARYAISNGIRYLWSGRARESFQLRIRREERLYLHSSKAGRNAWQDLRWSGQAAESGGSGKRENLVISAAAEGLQSGNGDAGPALRRLLDKAQNAGADRVQILLEEGDYHFYPDSALRVSLYLAGVEQEPQIPVAIPLVGLKNVELQGSNCRFIFHGRILPLLLMDSQGLLCRHIRLCHAERAEAEDRILALAPETVDVLLPAKEGLCWKNSFLYLREGQSLQSASAALLCKADGRARKLLAWPARAEKLTPDGSNRADNDTSNAEGAALRLRFALNGQAIGLQEGQKLLLRGSRPLPDLLLYHCRGCELEDIRFDSSPGNSLLAQRCEGLRLRALSCQPQEGSPYGSGADSIHLADCRGQIDIEDCDFKAPQQLQGSSA